MNETPLNEVPHNEDKVPAEELTWRELDVLQLLAEHLTNREIAGRLHLAESTVKDYVGRILAKLYVKNRRQAVTRARALGLLDGDGPAGAGTPGQVLSKAPAEVRGEVAGSSPGRLPGNLPAETTPFVGRRAELADIKGCLAQTRLLTLVGPGGMGKTRLALRAAADLAVDFPDGRFFVSLAPIAEAQRLVQSVAEALRFPLATHQDPQQQLLRFLKDKQLLLVMDNFEHLLAGAGLAGEILAAAPRVKILATSRERLNLRSESIFAVGGLALPDEPAAEGALQYDALALFAQSAARVRPGFEPADGEVGQIAHICQAVQGMPLAIELAAAWLHILSVDEIAAELAQGLDILAGDARDAPARQRDIRAVFDHSWSLLDQSEREIVESLAVFRGGFSREAAGQVSGASLRQLGGLVDKSLLSRDAASGRLALHELLRQYAQERLEQRPEAALAAREKHATYFAAFTAQRWQAIKGSGQMTALAEMEADIENARAAWRYCLNQGDVSRLWQLVDGLYQLYWIRGWNQAARALFGGAAAALAGREDDEGRAFRALAAAYQAWAMSYLDQAEQGYRLARESVATLRELERPDALVFALNSLMINGYFLVGWPGHREAIDEMLAAAERAGDPWRSTYALYAASLEALYRGDPPAARRFAEANLALDEAAGNRLGSTMPLIALGHVALVQGELARAQDHYRRTLVIARECGFYYGIQTGGKYLAKVTLSLGDIEQAEGYLMDCLAITREVGFTRDIVNLLGECARLRAAQGRWEQAVELLAVVLAHPVNAQRLVEGPIDANARTQLAELAAALPEDRYQAALARGRAMTLEEAAAAVAEG
jgi:predicted ATPase/DNA-binding CsgD family transcriptional regulator